MAEALASDIVRIAAGAAAFNGRVLLMAGACNDWIGEPLPLQHLSRFAAAELVAIHEAANDVIWDNPVATLALQLPIFPTSESMRFHESEVMDGRCINRSDA